MKIRVGYGIDVHQLAEGETLFIGGVKFDYHLGAVGHSDADVLLHAISDAILGAAGLRDIGYHFPDTSGEYKNIDSKILLKRVISLIEENDWRVENIDATVVLEQPKVNPRIDEIKDVLSAILKVENDAVGIKATTSEKLGYVGAEKGIQAHAVALLIKD
jgi:2-C-methyl-D-erythritol 2,4-cyclodiphosphate synthase